MNLSLGREKFPIFFRRGKLPFGPYKVEGPQAQARKKSEFLGCENANVLLMQQCRQCSVLRFVHGHELRVNSTVPRWQRGLKLDYPTSSG